MKVHASVFFALLPFGTLAAAQGGHVAFPHNRRALDTTDPQPYRDMHARPIDYTRPAVYRRAVGPVAPPKPPPSSWTPEVKGKYIKDTLKCDKNHVCSGEIVVAA